MRVAIAGVAIIALAWYWRTHHDDDLDPTWTDEAEAMYAAARNAIAPTPASTMTTSPEGRAAIQRSERLVLTRYRLGDGGWTIGYGRYYPDSGPPPPERIDAATAEAWFTEDLADRGERWVQAYVSVPLQQHQFDALVSMAYNLSPRSFKQIAAAVNAGDDPEEAALRFIRAGTDLERGLRNRRGRELALYRTGSYA